MMRAALVGDVVMLQVKLKTTTLQKNCFDTNNLIYQSYNKQVNMELNEEDWYVDCSDEEKYDVISKDDWYLKPEILLNMINKMECNKQCLELEWKCPGRRGPSPIPLSSHQPDHEMSDYKIEEKDNFDFMDEMSSPRLPVRRVGEATPKGSAKKKTASFNGALSTIMRHRRQEQQEISLSPKKLDPNSQNIKLHPS